MLAGLLLTLHSSCNDREEQVSRSREITLTSLVDHRLDNISDDVLLALFRFKRTDIIRIVQYVAWPAEQFRTRRNRYGTSPLLVTCVILRLLASPNRWRDLEVLFALHTPHLSQIFWEGLSQFVSVRVDLVMGNLHKPFWQTRFEEYAEAVVIKSQALENVVAFIDGTNLAIARPSGLDIDQRVAYSGHKRKHAIKFQALTTPCGLAMHLSGPLEGRRHDWTMYMRSGLDSTLQEAFFHLNRQFVAYGDSGYSSRVFFRALFGI